MRLIPGRRLATVAVQVPIPEVVLAEPVKLAVQPAARPLTRTERVRMASERPARSTVLAVTCGYPLVSVPVVEVTATFSGMSGLPLVGLKIEVIRLATNVF